MVPHQGAVRHHRPVTGEAAVTPSRLSGGDPGRVRPGQLVLALQGGTGTRVSLFPSQRFEAG